MSNLMSNIYIGLVVEIIKENGKPTLDIRVRIPSLHIGLKDEDLPIAKPILMPGMFVDPIHFENYFSQVNRVYVIFDSGSKAMPRYFGALSEGDSTVDSEENIIKRVVETKTVQGLIEPNLPNGQDLLLNVKRSVLSNWEVEAQAESDFVIPGTRYGEVKVGDRLYFTTGFEGLTNLGVQGYQTFKINYYDIVTKKFGVLYEDNNLYMAFFNNGFTYDPINEDFYILCGASYAYNTKEVLGATRVLEFIKPFKINKNTLIKTEVANVYNNDNEVLANPNGSVYHNGKIYISYGEKFTIAGKTWATADEVAFDNSKNAIEEIVLSPVTNITQMQTLFPVDTYELGTVISTVYEGTKTYYRVGLTGSTGKDSTLKIYDIETNTWSLGATPPESIGTQHQQGSSIIVDDKIYVKRSLLFNVYDITTNTWSSLQSPLVGDVHNEAPAYHNGYIYYGGGYVGGGSVTPVVPEARNSDIVQRYNISTNTWELHSRLPNLVNELQGYGSLIVKDNFMYYLLGYVYNHEDNNITYVNKTVYKYDLSKGTSYYQYDDNLLKENVDGLYVSKTELKSITDEQINNIANKLGENYISITYADLVSLRANETLKKGAFYHIIDYETITTQTETRSAGHYFDIIVQALDEKTLSENAQAIHSVRDTDGYFNNVKLEAWKLKYTLDNDNEQYYWADTVNGKGVIYQMIDEFGNDLPYDFKNIQFKRYKITAFSANTDLVNQYYALKDLNETVTPNGAVIDYEDFVWAYTFTVIDENGVVNDVSLNKNKTYIDDIGAYHYTKNNKIGSFTYSYYDEIEGIEKEKETLGNNVMLYDYNYDGYWNFFGFHSNIIGNWFNSNTIGSGFNSNTIGNYFQSNTIGSGFSSNVIENSFDNNTIRNDFRSNTIGNNFSRNAIGNYFNYNTIGNSIRYIQFSVDGDWSNEIRNLYIRSGLQGASSINKLDLYYSGLYHRTYPTTIEQIANGNILSIHQETPLVWAGKKKETNTSSIWSSVPQLEGNYVKFLSGSSRTITPKYTNSGVTLQYSVDSGATWTTIASGSVTTSATEHWFRGQATGTKNLFITNHVTNAWAFSGSSDLEVYGNLNFLLCDTLGDEIAPTSLANYCYNSMFRDCTSLTVAPELPATTLADSCYRYMFHGCTSLTTAPELPVTTLESVCYGNMFYGCTSLTKAPELPATTLESNCYAGMFNGCTSLTTAPELPATILKIRCYDSMFYGCTSLTTAPELPAMTLESYCYYSMFYNCTSLTTAPELPATTLTDYCYEYMFNGCTSLTTAPELLATTLTNYCYTYMFQKCTSLTTAPELPATTLADYCYKGMFQNCTSLTTAPELPATTLANNCYEYMFLKCTSFKVSATKTGAYIYDWRIPTSGTGRKKSDWNYSMLTNTGGTFTSDPTINKTYWVENKPI